ncbi:uncharacterized protein BCR38DRAFT_443199 [Pseudomassariella vexata]|uniref:Uncharacterized protein n=1 Tax=Pseudomassariella vexata TaxID=1141098 RepID=A0A1Y2DP07_9PEZI|nr:uncharacterized protein BCR38DRAFT_443199 [Pseudomassariella vexata]ORY61012.1 hypothetical protein BCR38DRAFT_443199 [Pseudomassariella vexata]
MFIRASCIMHHANRVHSRTVNLSIAMRSSSLPWWWCSNPSRCRSWCMSWPLR